MQDRGKTQTLDPYAPCPAPLALKVSRPLERVSLKVIQRQQGTVMLREGVLGFP